eukprot:1918553-Rhodomonas_salina.3
MSPAEAARAMMVMSELKVTTLGLTPDRSIRPSTSSALLNADASLAPAARAHALTARRKRQKDGDGNATRFENSRIGQQTVGCAKSAWLGQTRRARQVGVGLGLREL